MLNTIIDKFITFLPCAWKPTCEQLESLKELITYSIKTGYEISIENANVIFIEAVNQKLNLNNTSYKKLLDEAFLEKIKLNYIQKTKIKVMLDSSNKDAYIQFLVDNNIYTEKMVKAFSPIAKETTFQMLSDIIKNDIQYPEIISSIFSRFCFNLFPEKCVYSFFSNKKNAENDFFKFISGNYPDLCDRTNALFIIDVSLELFKNGYIEGCNKVLNTIKNAYQQMNNHCELAIIIPPLTLESRDFQWNLYSDCILFAEKHLKEKIDKTYFRWQKIGTQTKEYIPAIIPFNAEFEYAFQGFVFKDCFVIQNENNSYSLLLILEKNQRDERAINCPACRTQNIQGNSYPILNVRSWECENPLCPDRSKYNRGKRYAYMSLFRQKEMMNDENIIPDTSISRWRLDCQKQATKEEIIEMIIRHYSCYGDGVSITTFNSFDHTLFGRTINTETFVEPKADILTTFKDSSYFYRYIQYNDKTSDIMDKWEYNGTTVFHGDSLDVLRNLEPESISGGVTSPPYYNAKSYSQWQNIYCYLFDMYNIHREVFRTLKNGGVYLFNIFDYFDNENNVALSAMGNKRMILGAYMIDIFERIGFTICGNIIWNKGEIQGNRSFNQGNLTPYYQAPLNCWEHIMVLSKGEPDLKFKELYSHIEDIKPVVKIIGGKNVLGHDAPYPKDIPNLLMRCMNKDDIVLDPFLGSGTTCLSANMYGVHSIGIEKNKKYFELCKDMILSNIDTTSNT